MDGYVDQWVAVKKILSLGLDAYCWLLSPKRKWIDVFEQCDGILAYSEYGIRSLKKQSKFVNTLGCASPGINPNVFKPVEDKKEHKIKLSGMASRVFQHELDHLEGIDFTERQ